MAKVDELMGLCDRLEAAQAQRERQRDRLAAASLNRLNRPDGDTKAFRADARFHLDHLPHLTVRPDRIPRPPPNYPQSRRPRPFGVPELE